MKKNTIKPMVIFTIVIVALMGVVCLLFLNMSKPTRKVEAFDKGKLETEKGVEVIISPRGGSGGSWVKTLNKGKLKEKVTGIVYDLSVKNIDIGTVEDWNLKVVFKKRAYINKAWCGLVEIHQLKAGKSQTLDLRDTPDEEITLEHYMDGADVFIPLEKGDYIIYYPSDTEGEVPLAKDQKAGIGIILYSTSIGGINFDDCELTYTVTSDKKDRPEYYIIILLLGLFILLLAYFAMTFIQKLHTQTLLEQEKVLVHETMSTFVGFVDAKDPYTAGHSERVAVYTKLIAENIGYDEDEAMMAYYCGLLHDSGKISVSETVLNKPGRLNPEEFEAIKQHTVKGNDILKNLKAVPLAAVAARSHHERYDGTGYPDKLRGKNIPEIARIICVADAFDAMNSNRVYRGALQMEDIVEQLVVHRGTQFDPEITDVFLKLLNSGTINELNHRL